MTTSHRGQVTVRGYRDGDEKELTAALQAARGGRARPLADVDPRTWRWRIGDNPTDAVARVAVADDGAVAALYCAVPRVAETPHGATRFAHVIAPLTHPDHRLGAHAAHLTVALGRELAGARAEHRCALGYGMPRRAAARAARRLLGADDLGPVPLRVRLPDAALPTAPADVRLEHSAAIPPAADLLWRESLPRQPLTVRRDHRYLGWRYDRHPAADEYLRVTAWRGASLTGVMILRPMHDLIPDACVVADLVRNDLDEGTGRALLREACRVAALRDRTLVAVCADHDPLADLFAQIGGAAAPFPDGRERHLTLRALGDELGRDELADCWRFSLGDTELC